MKLASYIGNRKGIMGIGNFLIRLRLGSRESHTEIMFEPGDGVDNLMPDKTCEPTEDGALWHFSFVGLERLPVWSKRRAGRLGGARFKRIVPDAKWAHDELNQDPIVAAVQASNMEGRLYDWQAILRFVVWIVPNKLSRGMCSEGVAEIAGIAKEDAHLFDPRTLRAAVKGLKCYKH